jgi:predicted transcriptional regulator
MSIAKTFLRKATSGKLRYTQIGGKLGGLLTEILIGKGWIKRSQENEKVCYITDKGRKILNETEDHSTTTR